MTKTSLLVVALFASVYGYAHENPCDPLLLAKVVYEDPISTAEMRKAQSMAQSLAPFLVETFKADELNVTIVKAVLKNLRQAQVDLDGSAFRDLFLIVNRYLLAAKYTDGHLRPLSRLLLITDAQVQHLARFLAQLDIMTLHEDSNRAWPKFLADAKDPLRFIEAEFQGLPESEKPSPETRRYAQQVLAPVLGMRLRYARLRLQDHGRRLILLSPVGFYRIGIHVGAVTRRTIAPLEVRATDGWGKQNDNIIYAAVDVADRDEEANSYLRTLIRADAFFHPHLVPPAFELYPQPSMLSEVQTQAVDRLLNLDAQTEARTQGPSFLGLIMPTGEGKSVVTAEYIKEMMRTRWQGRRPKIILTVENTQILQQTVEAWQRDMGLTPSKITMLFGANGTVDLGSGAARYQVQRGSQVSPPVDFELIVTTRSTLSARFSSLKLWIDRENDKAESQRQPFVFVVDEAQHAGAHFGQYDPIFEFLKGSLKKEDRVLFSSATLWHPEKEIIRDILKGAVTGTHLHEDELRQLSRGEDLENLARTQFLRATIDGYVGPFEEDSRVLYDKADSRSEIRERLAKSNAADEDLYTYVTDLVRGQRLSGRKDRFVLFEVRQDRAEEGAQILQQGLGTEGVKISDVHRSACFVHSNLSMDEQNEKMAWFRDRGTYRGTRNQHKYLSTVSQCLEGVDIRGINGIVIMRNLSSNRLVQQVLGRGARLEPFKTGVRLIDVPGQAVAYLEAAGSLWDQAHLQSFKEPAQQDLVLLDEVIEPPAAAEISSREIDLEAALHRERQQMIAWREIASSEVEEFMSAQGGRVLLKFDPFSGLTKETVRLKSWFNFWFTRFAPAMQEQWRTQRDSLQLPDDERPLSSFTEREARQALLGFHLLAKMFNGLSRLEAMGLENITPEEQANGLALGRALAVLNPRFNFTYLPKGSLAWNSLLQFERLNTSKQKELSQAFARGEILGGAKPGQLLRAIDSSTRQTPSELLSLVVDLIRLRKHMQIPAVMEILNAMKASPPAARAEIQAWSGYYLGLILNRYLLATDLVQERPWNLNGYYGLEIETSVNGQNLLTQASEYELWTTLDLIDYRLTQLAER